MKQTLKLLTVAIALLASHSTFAQGKGSYLKYTVNGTAYNFLEADLNSYNTLTGDGIDEIKHTENHFYVENASKYKLDVVINTAPKMKPVVSKLPFVEIIVPVDGHLPSAYISIDNYVGEDINFYSSTLLNHGKFEITKVEGDWVEGVFELVINNTYQENDQLTITNGSFRFQIQPQMED